jgi:hypothetical protein
MLFSDRGNKKSAQGEIKRDSANASASFTAPIKKSPGGLFSLKGKN